MLLDAKTPVSLALAGLSLVKLSAQSVNYLPIFLLLISSLHGVGNSWIDSVPFVLKMTCT